MKACTQLENTPFVAYHGTKKELILAEKNSEYRIQNPAEELLLQVKVENGLIPEEIHQKKCDFLVARCERNALYLVELKGASVKNAAIQLLDTFNHGAFRKLLDTDTEVHARIISTRVPKPDLESSHYRKLEQRLAEQHKKGRVRVKATQFIETFDSKGF